LCPRNISKLRKLPDILSLDEKSQRGYCKSWLKERFEMKGIKFLTNGEMVNYDVKLGKMNTGISPGIILLS
jgi:hypothetical protein